MNRLQPYVWSIVSRGFLFSYQLLFCIFHDRVQSLYRPRQPLPGLFVQLLLLLLLVMSNRIKLSCVICTLYIIFQHRIKF